MSKIRINELARELEVKPNVILDLLPELGVDDKKTHSSSLDDDVALAVRRRLTGEEEPVVAALPKAERAAPPVELPQEISKAEAEQPSAAKIESAPAADVPQPKK